MPLEEPTTRILVPISDFVDKPRFFKTLKVLSNLKNPVVYLFRVVEVPRRTTPIDPVFWKEDINRAQNFLADVSQQLRSEGYTVETKVVTARDVADGIISEANNGNYAVVLLTKRRIQSGWGKIFHKSVSETVIRYTNPPVLTFLAEPSGNNPN